MEVPVALELDGVEEAVSHCLMGLRFWMEYTQPRVCQICPRITVWQSDVSQSSDKLLLVGKGRIELARWVIAVDLCLLCLVRNELVQD